MKLNVNGKLAALVVGAAVLGLVGVAQATPIAVGNAVVATGGDVTVKFVSASAADLDLAFLAFPNSVTLFNNSGTGQLSFDLGTFTAGTVLEFSLYNSVTKETFYTGAASENKDGAVHANVTTTSSGATVGFEDLSAADGSDWDYNDLIFTVCGGQAGPDTHASPVPDVATTLPLLGLSLAGLATIARRVKK